MAWWRAAILYLAVLAGVAALVVQRPGDTGHSASAVGGAVAVMAPVAGSTPQPGFPPAVRARRTPAWLATPVSASAIARALDLWAHTSALLIFWRDAEAAAFLWHHVPPPPR